MLVCLDIDGTLTNGIGGELIAGAVDAVELLRRNHDVRLVTNATSRAQGDLVELLRGAGLLDRASDLVTPATTARRILTSRHHGAGILLVDERARPDFGWFELSDDGGCVVVASEAHDMTIAELQPAFRALLAGAAFYTLQPNRYFRSADGELVTDLGPVAAFLGYAAGREPENLGKPSPLVFDALADDTGVTRAQIVMVGDDVEFDVVGPALLGITGVLVRTGKYRAGDEARFEVRPHAVLSSIAELPHWLDAHRG